MKKQEIIKNIVIATIPTCLILFGIGWFIFRNLIAACILPTIFFITSLHSNIGKYLDDKKREAAGVTKHRFKTEKVYELDAPNDAVAPSLYFETRDGDCLLINGQWIYNEETYGEGAKEYYDSEGDDFFNRYKKPYSFPATEFEIWVSNLDNEACRIVVSGDYMEPEATNWKTPEKYYYKRFTLIDKSELTID